MGPEERAVGGGPSTSMEGLEEMLSLAEVALKHEFTGLTNTEELNDTVKEMFSGFKLAVKMIQGTGEKFKTSFNTNARNKDDVHRMMQVFEENTYISPKLSRGL